MSKVERLRRPGRDRPVTFSSAFGDRCGKRRAGDRTRVTKTGPQSSLRRPPASGAGLLSSGHAAWRRSGRGGGAKPVKMTPELRLQQLGIELPNAPMSMGDYVTTKQTGSLVFLSGMLPLVDGKPIVTGRVSKEEARQAARLSLLNALAALKQRIGGLDRFRSVIRVA